MGVKEVLSHAETLVQLSTHTGGAEAASDAIPLVGTPDPLTKPSWEVIEMVLQVSTIGLDVAVASKGNHVDEHHQAHEQYDEHQHGHQVEYEQPRDPAEASDEARQSHHQYENPKYYDRPLQGVHARVGRLVHQPYPCTDDGDGEEYGHEVDGSHNVVVQCHL